MACGSCFGLMFIGSEHCTLCGKKTVLGVESESRQNGNCPRCKVQLNSLQIGDVKLSECLECGGFWCDAPTFEGICATKEQQANVLNFVAAKPFPAQKPVQYVPCPDCKDLMNRSNFARSSGVILDICKQHGVWFDSNELPNLVKFIQKGGIELARRNEKIQLEELKREVSELRRRQMRESSRSEGRNIIRDASDGFTVGDFIATLFD